MNGELRIAALQHDIVWNDRDANFEHLAPMIRAAAGAGAGLVLCTETFSTGFVVDVPAGEPEGGPSSSFLVDQAREHGVWVGGSCPEIPPGAPAEDERPGNSFVLAGPDGTVHRYRKIHPFSFGGEEKNFRAGADLVTVDIEGLRVSLFVCYDLRFADEFWPLALGWDQRRSWRKGKWARVSATVAADTSARRMLSVWAAVASSSPSGSTIRLSPQ